ncbi:flavodoxin family protein [uncultured Methanoregula sp.]|uniref:flavodoxin family protein n=1 Tax=uncultured Methanoregula sp. TaxID=1005933 RepID=UPI002AAB4FC0|nr:flavodoxin family protein [uncultured Methanoregula sp.]
MNGNERTDPRPVKSLVVVFSYHHKNTEKIANIIANVIDAEVKTPQQVTPEEIAEYDLAGFGSGIYGATFHASLLDLADRLLQVRGKKAFIFSTYGAPASVADRAFVLNNHSQIREKLQAKGYTVTGEFGCAGWNTNSFLKLFGGLNKDRPNAGDLMNAEAFARELKQLTGLEKKDTSKRCSQNLEPDASI